MSQKTKSANAARPTLDDAAALVEADRLADAEAVLLQVLDRTPADADAWDRLAAVRLQRDEPQGALAAIERAIAVDPDRAGLHIKRGRALTLLGRHADAAAAFQHAAALAPDDLGVQGACGDGLLTIGDDAAAEACFRQALALRPVGAGDRVSVAIHVNMGIALEKQGRLADAIAACETALAAEPELLAARNNLAGVLKNQARIDEAVELFRRGLSVHPDSALEHSNLLLTLQYGARIADPELLAEHRAWAARHAEPLTAAMAPPANPADPDRRLRLGYLSADFYGHPVGFFIGPVIAMHDRARLEVVCYASVERPDRLTELFRSQADIWRDVTQIDDRALAARMRDDAIDILVDLGGHTAGNRLVALAYKPAPVQASYLGYPGTTGMTAVGYRLTDAWADPPGPSDAAAVETLVRLPHGFLAYRAPTDTPDVGPLPAARNGYVTFGSLNNLAKVSPQAIALWSRLLAAVPRSRLMLKARAFADAGTRQRFVAAFAAHGIAGERLDLLARTPLPVDHFRSYDRVDIALDTLPYNGATTTCEALWMGVPVLALSGDRHAGRVGASLLNAAGLADLVAESPDAYVAKGVGLAGDLDRLADWRTGLRAHIAAAPLSDVRRLTRSIEAAYRQMWRAWCERTAQP